MKYTNKKIIYRIACEVFRLYFFWCLTLQFNDADWFISIPIYLSALLVTIALSFFLANILFYVIIMIAAGAGTFMYLIFTLADSSCSLDFANGMCSNMESFSGLAIMTLWFAVASWYYLKLKKKGEPLLPKFRTPQEMENEELEK